jgi:hypothetical protein
VRMFAQPPIWKRATFLRLPVARVRVVYAEHEVHEPFPRPRTAATRFGAHGADSSKCEGDTEPVVRPISQFER